MAAANSLFPLLSRLWAHIGQGQRRQLFLLILLMMVVALAEMVSIGAIFPFLAVLTGPERVFNHPLGQYFAFLFGLVEPRQLLLPITLLFAVAIVLAGCMRLLLVWVQTNISYAIGSDLALDVYRRTLYQPYAVHTSRNSSEIINGVYSKASGISSYVILPLVTIVSTATLVAAILVTLIGVDPFTSLLALAGFGVIYGGVIKLTHRRLFRNSRLVADEAGRVIKSLQEGLGGIRDVLIDRTQDVYCGAFRKADLSMRAAQINSTFIAQSPRFAMEALGMLLIATLAYNLAQGDGGIVSAMPVLGALALGAQRLLPLLQQCFQAWSSIRSNQASLADTLDLLEQPMPEHARQGDVPPLVFERNIRLDDVYFRYSPESDWVLRGVSLEIPKGSRVGVMGETGCGKSTMLDIVMGLLSPTSGSLAVDGVVIGAENGNGWQAHIAHVPQSVFLADSSIASNIAFGVPVDEIDMERVREAALRAQLLDTIQSWPEQFDTRVGERGVRLSGGQRQRIGIARALYKRADVLVFDEATSALDNETERAVMESIQALGADTTVLIIAHRLNTLNSCNIIVELGKGQVARVGSYRDILSNS
ncbi:ATP-binding cassette subfamily B protein [Azospira oryzae]|uniref:ATP-binding cassette subfamily B protein n=1 Tax=Azospira oryzae TaxID=146939 RepID=A0ABY0IUB1_9RHOO|nr:ABC transporter ATP-binding protein [Azospira oryzae]RZT90807.1 ATP-binding cassette subfamily B protein [Azospira oryzae]